MTPLELMFAILGTMMGFVIPIALLIVVIMWAANKWL
jgi:hypothetical protein